MHRLQTALKPPSAADVFARRARLSIGVCLACAAAVTTFIIFACCSPREEPADLRVIDGVSVVTLDPAEASWLQDIRILDQLFEGLFVTNEAGTGVEPGCAKLVDTKRLDSDGRVVRQRFRIRADARWSDGVPVRADDFMFAWRRGLEPGTARDYAFFFEHIRGVREYVAWRLAEIERIGHLPSPERKTAVQSHLDEADRHFARGVGITAEDDRTLLVDVESMPAYWSDLLAHPVFRPLRRDKLMPYRRASEAGLIHYDSTWCKPPRTCYNGPFVLTDWRFKRGLRLERNAAYHSADRIRLRSLECLDVADANTAWLMYETGRADWLLSMEATFAPELIARSASTVPRALNHDGTQRHDVHAFLSFGTYFYNFNCRPRLADGARNPFDDARVRRAFCLAVDRAALCDAVTRRGEPPATALIPPGTINGYPGVAGLSFDPAFARRLLAEAGWRTGATFPETTLLFNNEANHGLIAQSVAAMLTRNLGVRIRLVGKEAQSYRQDKKTQDFMIARASWYGDYQDPTSFLDVFRSDNGNNDSAFVDAEYDRRLKAADSIADPATRLAALAECERYLVADAAPLLPLFHYVNIYAYDPRRVSGVALNPRLLVSYRSVEVRR